MEQNTAISIEENIKIAQRIKVDSLFSGNSFFIFIYRKTEKIITALYLITGIMPENEPAKWRLRELGQKLLSFILDFHENKDNFGLGKIRSVLIELESLIDIAENAQAISPMNSSIIIAELTNVMEAVESHHGKNKIFLPNGFFDIGKETDKEKDSSFSKGHDKGHKMSFTDKNVSYGRKKQKRDLSIKDRKEIMLEIIRKNGEVNIKDISILIKDCSEKTIQRELLIMLNAGIIKKTGERRWSRYSLK